MYLPLDHNINTRILGQIYNNTVATYKYYWFISILDIFVTEERRKISFWEIIVGMIAEAWYPVHYFKLSFGKSDSLYTQIVELQKALNIPIDANKRDIKSAIIDNLQVTRIRSFLRVFTLNVPFRFLSPWINYTYDREVIELSQKYFNNCLYSLHGDTIEINPNWEKYLKENYQILRDFSFWNLSVFLQKRNPNVPDLSSKLVKPISRDSMLKQRNFWNTFIELKGPIQCIYTGKILGKREYALDHFVPWSFVAHDLLWNLLPSDGSINSSKSNNLPVLDIYLRPFAKIHQHALQTIYSNNPSHRLLEDYLTVHNSISELAQLNELEFYQHFNKTFSPLVQIAENMGFKYWRNM